MRLSSLGLHIALLLTLPLSAQSVLRDAPEAKDAPPPPGGTVSDRVVFADTNGSDVTDLKIDVAEEK